MLEIKCISNVPSLLTPWMGSNGSIGHHLCETGAERLSFVEKTVVHTPFLLSSLDPVHNCLVTPVPLFSGFWGVVPLHYETINKFFFF